MKIPKIPYGAYKFAVDNKNEEWFPSIQRKVERSIKKSRKYSYFYALDVIQGRWEVAEDNICQTAEFAYYYAINVVQGQLPEKMHNMMLLHSLSSGHKPKEWSKKYFDYLDKLKIK